MKTKKKCLSIMVILVVLLGLLAGCGTIEPEDETTIRIAGLRGPTSMGMVQMMGEASASHYSFSIHGTADEVTPKLIQGELDMAAIPANLAAVLYNNTEGAIQILAINTLGVLYITELGDTITSVEDLRGQTIYASGKGSSPEYGLRYILSENGIDPDEDVTIEFRSEATEVVTLLSQNGEGIAMLPQPYVFVAKGSLPDLRVAIDLNEAWDALGNDSMMVTGVLVARTDFVDAHPEAVARFLDDYRASAAYVNDDVERAAVLIEQHDIFRAAVAEKAIPYCNITFIEGDDMQTAMEGYLHVLYEQNPQSVGGKLPDQAFYYKR